MVALALALLLALPAEQASPAPAAIPAVQAPKTVKGKIPQRLTPLLVFTGNVALPDEVYLAFLDLPARAKATPAQAEEVEGALLRFLRRAGYDLATVDATVEGDRIAVDIEEGRLDRVLVLGEDAVGTVLLRQDLQLPENIFNRPLLERRLIEMSARFGLRGVRYELVSVARRDEPVQLEMLQQLRDEALRQLKQDRTLGRPPGTYELHVFIDRGPASTSLWPMISIDGDGLGVGVGFRRVRLFRDGDSFEVETRVAGNQRLHLADNQRELFVSRVGLVARWFTPPIGARALRGFLELDASGLDRQRGDLLLDSFRLGTVATSANGNFTVVPGFNISFGIGIARRWLFALLPADASSPAILAAPKAQTRVFATLGGTVIFAPEDLRRDRKHRADLAAIFTGLPGDQKPFEGYLHGGYQRILNWGYHELWVQTRGFLLAGEVPFFDERPVSDLVRGPFGSVFTRKGVAERFEFRFALVRDVLQLGLYDDAVFYAHIDPITTNESPVFADVLGLALHALVFDSIQVDVAFGAGLTTRSETGSGLSVLIEQAF